ncbi:MAG TPA: carboxypeptidase-like regulatory domain-containing protein [Thermoanaerobaculia bacterium]|nr:carboxypeptidase-like regulatory domain-containing protein [Thermoanaerobaculia bacterium]
MLAVALAFQSSAAVRYDIKAPSTAATPIEVLIVATRTDGPDAVIETHAWVPSSGTVAITEGTWEFNVKSDVLWAPPTRVTLTPFLDLLTIQTYEPSFLDAEVRTQGNRSETMSEIRATLAPLNVPAETLQVTCPVVANVARCITPAGTYDVRFSAPGFAPTFVPNVRLKSKTRARLDPLTLIPGASVVGRVITHMDAGTAGDAHDALVVLTPASSHDSARRSLRARPNARGVFVISGVPPGEYHATAMAGKHSSDAVAIRVLPNLTAELREPLVVARPRLVRAIISPPLDPTGVPWRVSLMRNLSDGAVETYASGSAQADGEWQQEVRTGGTYTLIVGRLDGGRWARLPIQVDSGDLNVPVYAMPEKIRGSVRYGDQPIAAKLHFGGESGVVREVVATVEDGTFEGLVPSVENDEWDVLIEAQVPPTSRTVRQVRGRRTEGVLVFDFILPRTAITGVVVNADGTAAENAIVSISGTASARDFDQAIAEADGTFQLSGLPPGSYRLSAEGFLKQSEDVLVEITEGIHPDVTLVLKPAPQIHGRVVFRGMPVVGTTIEAVRRNGEPVTASATSNESGGFVLFLPDNTTILDLLVHPPGFAVMMARIVAYQNRELLIEVEPSPGALTLRVPRSSNPMLSHAGAVLPVALFDTTSVERGDDRTIVLPAMEHGEYTLCIAASRCKSGQLAPNGTLELAVE